ncbi:MAG: cupin domain-containing protein [Cryomorphaceae bacterium]|nr:MAG: cupin domain-containing protein [Cryomorphaceae bacterium]
MPTDVNSKEIVLNLEKDGEVFVFYGDPDNKAPSVTFKSVWAPNTTGPGFHVHTKQQETFYVVSGTMVGRMKGHKDVILGPGESFVVPPGAVHTFYNASKVEPLETRITLEPALDFQRFITEMAMVTISKNGSQKDLSLLPELGYIMWKYRDEQRIGGMPLFVENMLLGTLVVIAKLTGKAKKIGTRQR